MDNIALSLVVPLYNGSEYICHFLQIVKNQSLAEMEVILVDDCSTDGWVEKAVKYLAELEFCGTVRFLSTDVNSGPGAARNVGLQAARGEYVCFVDCDDDFPSDFCKKLYDEARKWDADVVCCDMKCEGTAMPGPSFPSGEITPGIRFRILSSFATRICTYAFRRQFLMDYKIHFPNTRSAEDSAFVTWAWLRAKRASHLPEALYTYLLHPGSLTRGRMKRRAAQRIESMRFLKNNAGKADFPINLAFKWAALKKGYLMAIKDLLQ